MIDTIEFKLTIKEKKSWIVNRLENSNNNNFMDDNGIYIKLRRVNESTFTAKFNFSISKFEFGNNIGRYTHSDFIQSIRKLSEVYGLNMNEAIIDRIDLGTTFQMNEEPVKYLSLITSYKRMNNKTIYGINKLQSIYFNNAQKTIVIYNKSKDILRKRSVQKNIPITLASKLNELNLIRYEVRLKNALGSQLDIHRKVNIGDLLDKCTYDRLINIWHSSFQGIKWANINKHKSEKWENHFMLLGIENIGIDKAKNIINFYSKKRKNNPQQNYRVNNKFEKIISSKNISNSNYLYKEFLKKINLERKINL